MFLPQSWKLFLIAYLWVCAAAKEADHEFPVPELLGRTAPNCTPCKWAGVQAPVETHPANGKEESSPSEKNLLLIGTQTQIHCQISLYLNK